MQASALGDDGVQTVRYWLYAPGHRACMWDDFYARGIMGLAWGELGDLRAYARRSDMERQLLQTSSGPGRPTNDVLALWQFANEMKPGDVIFAKRGIKEIIGRGVVTGDYVYDADAEHYRNVRGVRWTHKGNWSLDKPWSVRKTLTEITDYTDRLAQLKAFFEEEDGAFDGAEMSAPLIEYPVEKFLGEVYMDRQRYDAIVGLLRAKKNVIMQGAPGVGKTFAAKRLAYSMMGVKDTSRVKLVSFTRATPTRTSSKDTAPPVRGLSWLRECSTPSVRRPQTMRRTTTSSSSTRSTAVTSPRFLVSCSCSSRAINVGRSTSSNSSTPTSCSACRQTSTSSA